MSKRGNREGSVYRRGDGRWAASISLPAGKRRTFYGKTRQEVSRKLTNALRDRDLGLPTLQERQRLDSFLMQWLEAARPTVKPMTWKRYEEYVRIHLIPVVGHVRLARLTPQHLQDLYRRKLEDGLSPTTVHHIHAVMHRALRQALRWGLVLRNVSDAVDSPRTASYETQPLSPEQAGQLLDAARGDRLEALYMMALTTGMRQGELLGLHWKNVDLVQGVIQVRTTLRPGGEFGGPKSSSGRRQITLVQIAVDALQRHRRRQIEERVALGPDWEDLDLVFTNTTGNHLDANNLRHRAFPAVLQKAGLSRIRFHDLRHSTATLLLSLGVHPKVVQELLGHSHIAITMDTYSHVMPNLQKEAMVELNNLLA